MESLKFPNYYLQNQPTVAEKPKEKSKESLHKSLRFLLVIAQSLSQFPLNGVTGEESKNLQFRWKSFKTLYTFTFMTCMFAVLIINLCRMFKKGTDIFIINDIVYYMYMIVGTMFFVKLAKFWPKLMKEWTTVEVSMSSYGFPKQFDLRIRFMTSLIFLLTSMIYILKIVSFVSSTFQCKKQRDFFYHFFAKEAFIFTFEIVEYSALKGIWMQLLDIYSTYIWSFFDLFIMIMSTSLALRFRQVTARLQTLGDGKVLTESVWKGVREDYNRLCKLCKSLDDGISYIILLSFAGNLFFILIQLFNSLRAMKNNLERIYFFVSFGFMIMRTVYVSLYGAWINDESKRPISILNSVPSSVYNVEIRRFVQQITFDTVALTGRNFFSVTRGLILSIAGAIVTYELVLIQFNENLLKEVTNNSTDGECL